MNIYINRLPVFGPWGGGAKFINSAYKFFPELGHEVIRADDVKSKVDSMLMIGMDQDCAGISVERAIMYKEVMRLHRNVKIILRVNENDARKGTTGVDKALVAVSKYVDGTVFVSRWLQEYFEEKGWSCPNNIIIKNGVDSSTFSPKQKKNNGKINIVSHHWSDNQMKGFDIYEKLDEWLATPEGSKFTFTYIGRHRNTFKNTKIVNPLIGTELGDELGSYDVYLSASRFDPGPNHILESLACGLPTLVHVDGGGCVEFAGEDAVFNDWDELRKRLVSEQFPNVANTPPTQDWQSCMKEYVNFIESVPSI